MGTCTAANQDIYRFVTESNKIKPYHVHHAYETLHPYTDGNGRTGRSIWLWGMLRSSTMEARKALELGFLHTWYYQSLNHARSSLRKEDTHAYLRG